MKYYNSLFLMCLLSIGFSACSTEDLENDVKELEEKMITIVHKVETMNNEIELISALLDGSKMISNVSYEGNNIILQMSDGNTITLNQGIEKGNYPSVEIGENGNWFINGEDSGKRAKAKDGDDATFTPEFKIDNNKWYVRYDNTSGSWIELDECFGTNPITAAEVSDDGNFLNITFDGLQYSIPIVENLKCAITTSTQNGVLSIQNGAEGEVQVQVNIAQGDRIRVIVPADWKYQLPDYSSLSGEETVTVTVTAPSVAGRECLLEVELIRGNNVASDNIKLRSVE